VDFAAEGLLDDLEGEALAGRRQLLTRLVDDGFELADLKRAVAEDRLVLLPVDRLLGGSHTAEEVQAETGLPAETMILMRRLLGLPTPAPGDRVFSDEDINAARAARRFLDAGFSEDAIAEITRVLGEGMARLAATITAAFAEAFLSPGDNEEAVAARFEALAQELTPRFEPVLVAGFTAQLRDSVGRGMLGRAQLEAGDVAGGQELAVAFADLVGFTRLAGQVELRELGSVAGRLAGLAASVADPPVRLIKTIGDAAMFVSPDPAALVAVALEFVAAVEAAGLPSLRAGIAVGPAVVRAGDYFGNSVNLASRVTGVARPGSVLCTQEVRDAAPDAFHWSSAGRHKVKGVSAPVSLHRARPLDHDAAAPEPAEAPAGDGPRSDEPTADEQARKRRGDRSRKRGPS
jgi:adenylate cyclase